jgi:hypothetical protein
MAAAVPFIIKGGSMLAGALGGKKAIGKAALKGGAMLGGSLLGKKLSGASKQQTAATQGTQQSADALQSYASPLMQQGQQMAGQGQGYLGQAGQYYSNILSNRRSARESLAPEMKGALDFYKGASGKASRSLRGGSRDYALAELDREKTGNMAMMLPQARRQAAEGAAGVGGDFLNAGSAFTGQGGQLATNAATVNQGLFNQAKDIRAQEGEGGKQWGSILYDAAQAIPWGKKPTSATPTSSGTTPPNYTGALGTSYQPTY